MPLLEPRPYLVRGQRGPLALLAGHDDPAGRHRGDPGDPEHLQQTGTHRPYVSAVLSLTDAADLTRTGDVWLFRGTSTADRLIRTATNAPVNHVGMAVVLEDLPPLLWHAELGQSLPDVWTGEHHRGVQLHVLVDAVTVWHERYGQRAWLRQLEPQVTAPMEDAALRTVARLSGTPFPTTVALAGRWARGRVPLRRTQGRHVAVDTAFCAEVLARTYQAMGLLTEGRAASWYDPGSFWSGDHLALQLGRRLGSELAVT